MDYKEQITNRLVLILKHVYSENRSRMGVEIGVDESRIRSYTHKRVNKRSMPPAEFIASLVEKIGINPEWLLLGKGDMLKSKLEILNPISEPLSDYGQNKIDIHYSEFKKMIDLSVSQQEVIRKQNELIEDLNKSLIELSKKNS